MKHAGRLQRILHRISPLKRERGAMLRRFYDKIGFVNFGTVHQHDDEYDAIRGFTASLTHQDGHFAVGSYEGYDIRMVERFDILSLPGQKQHLQTWAIIEINLNVRNVPHIFFVPTGNEGAEYSRLFATQPYMQPINSLFSSHHSPEFHGRYQILARTTHARDAEVIFDSPTIVGIGSRFWPHGIEVEHGKLFVYLTEKHLTRQMLDVTLASALWLAGTIRQSQEDI
ncbi:MAG TPA: hypothetical protein VN081_05705 [Dongiaceae bacterium]|nr:hypothetical protein [Dongiaceae bacterium]